MKKLTHTNKHTHIHIHTHTQKHTHKHSYPPPTHTHTNTNTRAFTRAHTHACICLMYIFFFHFRDRVTQQEFYKMVASDVWISLLFFERVWARMCARACMCMRVRMSKEFVFQGVEPHALFLFKKISLCWIRTPIVEFVSFISGAWIRLVDVFWLHSSTRCICLRSWVWPYERGRDFQVRYHLSSRFIFVSLYHII